MKEGFFLKLFKKFYGIKEDVKKEQIKPIEKTMVMTEEDLGPEEPIIISNEETYHNNFEEKTELWELSKEDLRDNYIIDTSHSEFLGTNKK